MTQLFYNAKIFTSDLENLYADALLVRDGKVLWTGALEDRPDIQPDEATDLQGHTVIPGFIDAHMHPVMLADYARQIACLPPAVCSIEDLKREIRAVHDALLKDLQEHPEQPLPWILGWGYDEGKYAERRSPNRYDLDEASPDLPVFLVRSCEHIRCVNSKALEIAGVTRETPDPQGGELGRGPDGEPDGILRESARDLVIPFLPERPDEARIEALVDLGDLLVSQGITGIAGMGNLHAGGNYGLIRAAQERGFRPRVSLYYMWEYFEDDDQFDLTPELLDRRKRLRIAGIKLIGDGSISGKTAWMHEPYLGTNETGIPVYPDDLMESAIRFAKRTGCQIAVHAMGGRAIDRVIDRVAEQDDWTDGSVPYVRVEHVTEPRPEALRKAAEHGIAMASQPIFEYCEIETYRANMDAERLKHLYPHRTILDSGVKLCLSTDAPATSWAVPSDPFPNLKSAVTRVAYDGTDIGQAERLDIETAVILYTKESAEISGMAGSGMLKAGYDADFAVLSDDLFTIDPMRIDEVQVLETRIGGECVYRKG
ncbi:MAG: amidohydrolase [Mogibacterium sp.]|nr:amidohydrolase [Mogibacterium sp.]